MNNVKLSGVLVGLEYSHETHREKFYVGTVSTKRNSGVEDMIPITVSERLMDKMVEKGSRISVIGEMRSYNKIVNNKSRCVLSVFVKDVVETNEYDEDVIEVEGFLCKNLGTRLTPQNRKIADIIIAVNRLTDRSDYLPCIVWNDRADYVSTFDIGEKVSFLGRIQSREYDKMTDNGVTKRVAYEVSISEICKMTDQVIDNDDFEGLFDDLDDIDE